MPIPPPSAAAVLLSLALLLPASVRPGERVPFAEPPAGPERFQGSVSVGYDSSYVYRGGRFGDDAPWSGVDLNVALAENVALNFGTWYINPTRNAVVNDEFDFYAYLSYEFDAPRTGPWSLEAGGSWSGYLEDDYDETEVSVSVTKSIGELCDVVLEYVYDITYTGHYLGGSAEKTVRLGEKLDLNLSAGASVGDDHYNFDVIGGDNAFLRVGTTCRLSETLELGAYVLQNWPFGGLSDAGEESGLYGGGSLLVSF